MKRLMVLMVTILSVGSVGHSEEVARSEDATKVSLAHRDELAKDVMKAGGTSLLTGWAAVAAFNPVPVVIGGGLATGYFLGKAVVHADSLYLDGSIVDATGNVFAPVFQVIYKMRNN